VKPGYDYYNRLYNTPSGELFLLKEAYRGASVFDILKLKFMSVETASLVDDLAKFGLVEFTGEFLEGLNRSFLRSFATRTWTLTSARLMALPSMTHVWRARSSARPRRLIPLAGVVVAGRLPWPDLPRPRPRQQRPLHQPLTTTRTTWCLPTETVKRVIEPEEKARRIWEWWTTRVKDEKKNHLLAHRDDRAAAVRPCPALVRLRGAGLSLSQIKLIPEQIVVVGLEETTEARTMVRCNTVLTELEFHLRWLLVGRAQLPFGLCLWPPCS
jgi:hypothetical protein